MRIIVHGSRQDAEGLREAVAAAREAGHRVEVRATWEEGDAIRYAAEAAHGARVVVAAGGDGTVREVAAGLVDALREDDGPEAEARSGAALAVLPLGTANDFATSAGVPLDDPGAALELALEGGAGVPVDVVRVGSLVYLNLATAGPATRITVETPDGFPRLRRSSDHATREPALVASALKDGSPTRRAAPRRDESRRKRHRS